MYQRVLTLADSSGASSEQIIRIDDVVKFDGELFDEYGSESEISDVT